MIYIAIPMGNDVFQLLGAETRMATGEEIRRLGTYLMKERHPNGPANVTNIRDQDLIEMHETNLKDALRSGMTCK